MVHPAYVQVAKELSHPHEYAFNQVCQSRRPHKAAYASRKNCMLGFLLTLVAIEVHGQSDLCEPNRELWQFSTNKVAREETNSCEFRLVCQAERALLAAERGVLRDAEVSAMQTDASPGRPVLHSMTLDGQLLVPRSPKSIGSSVVAEPTDASSITDNVSADGGSSVRSGGRR